MFMDGKWHTVKTEVDGSVPNQLQTISISNDTIYLSNGGFVKLPSKNLPQVQTTVVTGITTSSATLGGTVIADNGNVILMKGVCWATLHNPTTSNQITAEGPGNQSFNSVLTNLSPNTTYYLRAYATSVAGTGYGSEISFTTNALSLSTLVTNEAFNISNNSASAGGDVSNDGGADITARGLCWSTTTNPTINDNITVKGAGTGTFNTSLTGLAQGTIYYVRAFATNSVGTAYGNQISFTTNVIPLATIHTSIPTNITYTSAISGGEITNDGGNTITAKGICYGTTANPTITNSVLSGGAGLGNFVSVIPGLIANTTYYLRAFATNAGGTSYGEQYSFTTLAQTTPALTTKNISGISTNSANGGGNITDDGGSPITARGICWNTIGAPTSDDGHTIDGTGIGNFNSIITGLNLNTNYFVRAYATNSNGTAYGQEISFTTLATIPPANGMPVIGTKAVSASTTLFNSGGYISSDGGTSVTQRGVCWGINENPTIANNFTTDGTGKGLFNSTIANLEGCGTVYYVRAYATNSSGTSYGNQVTIASGLLPVIESSSPITNISLTSAVSGGNITSDGGCPITERGVCWSTYPNPTINNDKSNSGIGTGTFIASISGLYPNYTYYARVYATNSAGTVYGSEMQFTTQAGSSGIAIGQFYAGGYIFYIDDTGNHGLVCAPSDLPSQAFWGCSTTSISGTSINVGSGATNTAIILASCSEAGIAARLCADLSLNGYNDWFLPSDNELVLMNTNLKSKNIANLNGDCLSSSEGPNNSVWWFRFAWALNSSMPKTYRIADVRAARAF